MPDEATKSSWPTACDDKRRWKRRQKRWKKDKGDKGGNGDRNGNKTELLTSLLTHLFENAKNLNNTKEPLTELLLLQKLVILDVLLEALASILEVPNL